MSVIPNRTLLIRKAELDVRQIAKEHGVKVRRNPFSGIDVKFPDGKKKKYLGWLQLQQDLVESFNLLD